VAPSIGLTTAEEREEREELELELGLLNTLELGRPEELELELGRPEELGLPVVRGDILDDPDEDPKPVPVLPPPKPELEPPLPDRRWAVLVLKLVGLSVRLLITEATSAASAYLISMIANSSSEGSSTSI
tara:strand:+ start:125 stop:514 length:390 start_codon:yes stop_codon:yes gene_type:complete